MLASNDIYSLINYLSFVQWLSVGASIGALLVLRYKRPDMRRPIKVRISERNWNTRAWTHALSSSCSLLKFAWCGNLHCFMQGESKDWARCEPSFIHILAPQSQEMTTPMPHVPNVEFSSNVSWALVLAMIIFVSLWKSKEAEWCTSVSVFVFVV